MKTVDKVFVDTSAFCALMDDSDKNRQLEDSIWGVPVGGRCPPLQAQHHIQRVFGFDRCFAEQEFEALSP
jgi:hypothetical protein